MRFRALLSAAVLACAGCQVTTVTLPGPPEVREDLVAKIQPADELEASMVKRPVNPEALADRAIFLARQADSATEPAAATALRQRAYAFGAAAQQTRSHNLLLPLLLAEIRADGSRVAVVHDPDPKVNALITDGEEKFARRDLDGALAAYAEALAVDPKSYRALLYSGDVYFARKEFEAALPWFDRAIAAEPAFETAHRYRGDALMRLKRPDEARDSYIEAFIDAPFAPLTTTALTNWLGAQHRQLERPDTSFLSGEIRFIDGKPSIVVDPKRPGPFGLAYLLARNRWVTDQKVPASGYRHSLAEEAAGIRLVLQLANELRTSKPSDPELAAHARELAFLERMEREGLLDAFILLDRPTPTMKADYESFRSLHRDVLVRYLRTVWLGAP